MDSRVIMTNEGEELQISADDGWASVTVELTNLVVGEEYTRDYLMVDHSVSPHVNMYCNNWPSEITSGPCGFDSTFTAQYSSIFVVTHFPALEDSTQACLEIDISDSSGSIATEIGCWNQQSISDWDNDGVIDLLDTCGDTPVGTIVNANGCVETIAMPDTAPTCWVGYWVGTAGTPQNNWNWTEKMSGWNEFDAPDNGEFTLALPKGDYYVYFGCWDAQEDSITLSVAGLPVTREFEADVSWVWGWDEFSITDNEVGNQHDMVITWSSTDFGGTVTIHFEGVETVADSVAESDSGGLPGFPASLALVSLLGAAVILSRRKD